MTVIILTYKYRSGTPISLRRFAAIFAVVLAMHVVVIGGILAYSHFKHS